MSSKLFFIILLALSCRSLEAQVSITLDTSTQFQTIEGWGHGGGIFSSLNYSVDPAIRDSLNFQYLDFIAHDLGLTGSRMWEVGPRIDGTGMDNGDCDSIDWSKFQVTSIDSALANYAVYFKNLVESEGYQTSFYSSPTYPTSASILKPWVLNDPGERAQQIWADALWWKKNYGIDINYDVIFNEPSGVMTSQIIADDIKALGPRMKNLGLDTKTQYAEAVAPQTEWNFITPIQNDSDLWQYVGRLSYHNYGTADPYRADIRDFGKSLGLPTAQTEMGNPTIDDIFNDLIFGGVTYWEVGFSGNVTLVPVTGNTCWTPSGTYYRMRQLLHYVRPGDVRIEALASDSLVRVVAFTKNGKVTTVILNNGSAKTVTLNGLPPGSYGLSQSPSGAKGFQELGIQTVGENRMITCNLGSTGSATTLYTYSGANHPPTIMTYSASPGYLISPTSTISLSSTASDPELDQIHYQWSVFTEPVGSNAIIANPTSQNSPVNGLTVAGSYIFKIDVSDGINTSSRKVYVIVYPSNPPPDLGPAGFRIAAPYGLVFSDPGVVTHANIELPTSSATLQIQIGDLANSDFTGRGKWTLVSQPSGANATFDDTTKYYFISIRRPVSNMIVPGDYVFQCNITNPGHPDLTAQIICTVHLASSGPLINSMSANPQTLTLPLNTIQLSAMTTDPQGQLLRYWWVTKSAPAGTNPIFDHQGLAASNVTGLNIPGNYVFTLRAFDDIHTATKDITVVVKNVSGSVQDNFMNNNDVAIYPNPVSEELKIQIKEYADNNIHLTLASSLGQIIYEIQSTDEHNYIITLPMQSMHSGIYFLTIQTKEKYYRKKIVKE